MIYFGSLQLAYLLNLVSERDSPYSADSGRFAGSAVLSAGGKIAYDVDKGKA